GTDGKVTADFGGDDIGRAVAVQPDGKIIAAGYSETNGDFALIRYTSSGTPDDTFGSAGKVTTSYGDYEGCLSVAVQADGKIVAAGFSMSESVQDFAVMRYNSDGSLDTGFDGDGIVTTPVGTGNDAGIGLLIQPDEKIVVTGISYNGTDNDFAVVRYNSDGSLDTSFGGDGTVTTPVGSGEDMGCFAAVQSDGKIVLAGYSFNGSNDDFAVVRYNTDGSLDTGFGTGGKLITPVGSGDDRSYDVCIQSDGKIVITGESYNGSNYDFAVARYNSDGTLDTTFGNGGTVTADTKNADNGIHAAAIQSDGNIVTAGYSFGNRGVPDFSVVRYLSGNLSPARPDETKILADDGSAFDVFGCSVSISGDYAIVGARYDDDNGNNSGSAYIFKKDETGWIQQTKLTTINGNAHDSFGISVSISGDYAIVGAIGDDEKASSAGSAYIFKRDGTVWTQQAKLTASDGAMYDCLGNSVSISGDYAIVGAKGNDDNGSVYIFKRDGTTWIQHTKLTANDGANSDYFGSSVSISGDYAIVGAIGDDDKGDSSGSAYIFIKNGDIWTQQSKLTASDGGLYSSFGCSVSISGDYAIAGSTGNSAYIFKRDGTSWNEQAILKESGSSVFISGDYAVVGNPGYDNYTGLALTGSAYIFKRNGTLWNELFRLTASDSQEGNSFGAYTAISDGHAIIGVTGDDYNGSESGSAYIYYVGPSAAEIYSPAPGATLNSTTATLRWNNSDASQYWMWIGSTGAGSKDLYSDDQGINTSGTIYSLPNSGETLYVRLHSLVNGEWLFNDYTYTAYTVVKAEMQSPASESVLSSTSETFAWSDAGAEQYWMWIGTAGFGSKDLYSDGQGTNTSGTIYSLPNSGETLYVRLHSLVNGEWFFNDYTYTAYTVAKAEMQSPASESVLSSTSETFVWSDAGAEQYWMWIGTAGFGSKELYSGDQGANTSGTIHSLPSSGETLYVRLHSLVDGVWFFNDYTYTACTITLAEMQSPTPGSSLGSTTETFVWSDAGADQYWLWIGTSPGGKDVYSDGQGTNISRTVANLPSAGSVYVRLHSLVNGNWMHNDYTYTAGP
ncbi:MAG: hypothetical protein GY795_43195, partial [Desulfobacterales bacterium]|nr:hypothetical protein [Desulfobacterales bacterium]